jgi:hypothetical protein
VGYGESPRIEIEVHVEIPLPVVGYHIFEAKIEMFAFEMNVGFGVFIAVPAQIEKSVAFFGLDSLGLGIGRIRPKLVTININRKFFTFRKVSNLPQKRLNHLSVKDKMPYSVSSSKAFSN